MHMILLFIVNVNVKITLFSIFGVLSNQRGVIVLPLYEKIESLCNQNGINITQMCKNSGVARAILSDYKCGRKQSIGVKNLTKIADYFDVSVGYLLGDEKKPPADEDRELIKDELVAFYGGAKKDLTKADIDDIKSLIRLRAELNRGKE